MKSTPASEKINRLEKLLFVSPKEHSVVNVVIVYEDESSRAWGRELHERLNELAGPAGVRPTWWKLTNLSEPGVLAAAVSTAMRADVIVVASQASEGLPLPFYVWLKSWLPHRLQPGGILVAMLGKPSAKTAKSGRVGDYLRGMANLGHMHFLLQERKATKENKIAPRTS